MDKGNKHILVVSDNIVLLRKFKCISEEEKYSDFTFDFTISPFSSLEIFQSELIFPIKIMDIKNSDVIENLVNSYSIIFSVHCKQMFPKSLVDRIRCINIHPGYNPINRGWYPQVFSIIHKLPIGATIHEIDEHLDHGKIIDRKFVSKEMTDTSITLYNKVVEAEIELIEKNLLNILKGEYYSFEDHLNEHLFLKEDFKKLTELDLNEVDTLGNFIDKLRALTHGDFKNAYFIDPGTGEKIYVKIQLDRKNDQ